MEGECEGECEGCDVTLLSMHYIQLFNLNVSTYGSPTSTYSQGSSSERGEPHPAANVQDGATLDQLGIVTQA